MNEVLFSVTPASLVIALLVIIAVATFSAVYFALRTRKVDSLKAYLNNSFVDCSKNTSRRVFADLLEMRVEIDRNFDTAFKYFNKLFEEHEKFFEESKKERKGSKGKYQKKSTATSKSNPPPPRGAKPKPPPSPPPAKPKRPSIRTVSVGKTK